MGYDACKHFQPNPINRLLILIPLSQFLQSHPGGATSIIRMAGKDATRLFKSLHPPGTLEEYAIDPTSLIDSSSFDSEEHTGKPRFVGLVDRDTIVALPMEDGAKTVEKEKERTPLGQIIGLPDFEVSTSGRCGGSGKIGWSRASRESGDLEVPVRLCGAVSEGLRCLGGVDEQGVRFLNRCVCGRSGVSGKIGWLGRSAEREGYAS
jgi:hypothetical protein